VLRLPGRVLLVDDDVVSRSLCARVLSRTLVCDGIEVADNGAVGLEAVSVSPAAYCLVLMDNAMPVMDGATAARGMRAAGYTGCLLMSTGDGADERLDDCGADGVLTKPLDTAALLALLRRHGFTTSSPAAPSPAPAPAPPSA